MDEKIGAERGSRKAGSRTHSKCMSGTSSNSGQSELRPRRLSSLSFGMAVGETMGAGVRRRGRGLGQRPSGVRTWGMDGLLGEMPSVPVVLVVRLSGCDPHPARIGHDTSHSVCPLSPPLPCPKSLHDALFTEPQFLRHSRAPERDFKYKLQTPGKRNRTLNFHSF